MKKNESKKEEMIKKFNKLLIVAKNGHDGTEESAIFWRERIRAWIFCEYVMNRDISHYDDSAEVLTDLLDKDPDFGRSVMEV